MNEIDNRGSTASQTDSDDSLRVSDHLVVLRGDIFCGLECSSIERTYVDLVVLTSIAALVSIASGVLAFLIWVRQQVDAARQENKADLRIAREQIYEQLRRELSAELRAELYEKLLDASAGESFRERSGGADELDKLDESAESDVNRLSDTH